MRLVTVRPRKARVTRFVSPLYRTAYTGRRCFSASRFPSLPLFAPSVSDARPGPGREQVGAPVQRSALLDKPRKEIRRFGRTVRSGIKRPIRCRHRRLGRGIMFLSDDLPYLRWLVTQAS